MKIWTGHEEDVAAVESLPRPAKHLAFKIRLGLGIGGATLAHPLLPLGPQPDGSIVALIHNSRNRDSIYTYKSASQVHADVLATVYRYTHGDRLDIFGEPWPANYEIDYWETNFGAGRIVDVYVGP